MDQKSDLSIEDILHLTALKEVFGGFAHEIAQPLNAIMIASQIVQLKLERSTLSDEEKAFFTQRLTIIGSQVQRVTQVVETFRSFGRGGPLVVPETDIRKIFDRIYGLLAQQFTSRGIAVTVEQGTGRPCLPEATPIVEGVLVLGLVFARDTIGLIGSRYANEGISYEPRLNVKVAEQAGQTSVHFLWNQGSPGPAPVLPDTTGHFGLATARQALIFLGGNLEVDETSLTIIFPR
jgi:hypothetical protein